MFEKVNPAHPDKVADRIAGAIVDLAYKKYWMPKIAVEVLIGHNYCHVIAETSERFTKKEIKDIVWRIAGKVKVDYKEYRQDMHLAQNQKDGFKCGENGIFKGVPVTPEQQKLSQIARKLYRLFPFDGKYILSKGNLTICQSNADSRVLSEIYPKAYVNPLGDWCGGLNVDTGATNRKLGSDMADGVTGGGLHGKDFSKADVSVNIYAFIKAQTTGKPVEISCSIGDSVVDGKPYKDIVEIAKNFIKLKGGFEKFAEWGLF